MEKTTDRRLFIEIGMKTAILAALILAGVFVPPVQTAFLAVAYFMMYLPPLFILLIGLYLFYWYVPFFRYENFSKKKAAQRAMFVTVITLILLALMVSAW